MKVDTFNALLDNKKDRQLARKNGKGHHRSNISEPASARRSSRNIQPYRKKAGSSINRHRSFDSFELRPSRGGRGSTYRSRNSHAKDFDETPYDDYRSHSGSRRRNSAAVSPPRKSGYRRNDDLFRGEVSTPEQNYHHSPNKRVGADQYIEQRKMHLNGHSRGSKFSS